jgi:fructose-1,6-bisphosphatase/inositol monophosphatase family enzyme
MSTETIPELHKIHRPRELDTMQRLLPGILETVRQDYQSVGLKRELKEGSSVVTETDIKIDQLITQTIRDEYPNDIIVAEESAPELIEGERLWIVDALCGSDNFSSGILSYATNIALFENGKPTFSFVVDHPNQTHYWASDQNSSVYEGDNRKSAEIALGMDRFINADPGFLIDKQSSNLPKFGSILKELNDSGYYCVNPGTSLSFTYAALGKYGGVIVADVNHWDAVASCYLTEKNGGVATDFSGDEWNINTRNFVLSIDPETHSNLLSIVKSHWK